MGTISVSLPSDGSAATVSQYNTPINTIVNAINGGLDNANIASGAAIAGSKIADATITPEKLSTGAITLGYAQITSDFTTTSTSQVQATGLTSTVTIPAGGRRIKITAYAQGLYTVSGSGARVDLSIWDGTVGSGTRLANSFGMAAQSSGAGSGYVCAIVTPSAGSKTYNIGMSVSASTGTLSAAATAPAFILVEAI